MLAGFYEMFGCREVAPACREPPAAQAPPPTAVAAATTPPAAAVAPLPAAEVDGEWGVPAARMAAPRRLTVLLLHRREPAADQAGGAGPRPQLAVRPRA